MIRFGQLVFFLCLALFVIVEAVIKAVLAPRDKP